MTTEVSLFRRPVWSVDHLKELHRIHVGVRLLPPGSPSPLRTEGDISQGLHQRLGDGGLRGGKRGKHRAGRGFVGSFQRESLLLPGMPNPPAITETRFVNGDHRRRRWKT